MPTWPGTPRTWTPTQVSVSDLNTEVRDRMNVLKESIADDGVLIDDTSVDVTITANAITLNLKAGRVFTLQPIANITTTTLQNVPSAGHLAWFVVRTKGDGTARTWTWFASTVVWAGGFVPTRTSTLNKFDWYMFLSLDGGTSWHGFTMDQNFS